jgi:hypothetical protein
MYNLNQRGIITGAIIIVIVGYAFYIQNDIKPTESNEIHKIVLTKCANVTLAQGEYCIKNVLQTLFEKGQADIALEELLYLFNEESFVARNCFWLSDEWQGSYDFFDTKVQKHFREVFIKNISPRVVYNCYFEIGNSIFNQMEKKLDKEINNDLIRESLDVCVRISPSQRALGECAEGVYSAVLQSGHVIQSVPHINWCLNEDEKFRTYCIYETVRQLSNASELFNTFEGMLAYIRQAPTSTRQILVKPTISYLIRSSVSKVSNNELIFSCRSFPEDLQNECFRALIVGVWEGSIVGEEARNANELCSEIALTPVERELCFIHLIDELKNIYSVPLMDKVCRQLPSAYESKCFSK